MLVIIWVMIVSFTPFSGPHAESRDAVLECDGGLLVWSQPSVKRYLIFFKGTGKSRSLDVEAVIGRKVLFGVPGKGRNQIHADTKSGSARWCHH
jgi:hypothetical protein